MEVVCCPHRKIHTACNDFGFCVTVKKGTYKDLVKETCFEQHSLVRSKIGDSCRCFGWYRLDYFEGGCLVKAKFLKRARHVACIA